MRSNVNPSSNKKDTKNGKPFVFETFSKGTVKDPPASEISDCLADSMNLTIYPRYYEGRTGNEQYGSQLPPLKDRTGYSAHKSGDRIISDSGSIFTSEDTGNYFNFGDHCEMMTQYISGTEMVGSNSEYRSGIDCSVFGMPNLFFFHTMLRRWVILLGNEIVVSNILLTSHNRITVISQDQPHQSETDYSELEDKVLLFNASGMFKVDYNRTFPIAYKVNTPPPSVRIEPVAQTDDSTARYRFLYSAARMELDGTIVGRKTPGMVIAQETGTNEADGSDMDFSEVYADEEISASNPCFVGDLYVPVNRVTGLPEWHLTHFPIYRTYDLEALDPDDVLKEKYNDPMRYIWVKDLRMCAAFYGSIVDGVFTAEKGEFEIADTYSTLETDDGQRFEILEYLSATQVRVDIDYYGDYSLLNVAAMIGNGRAFRATVENGILTRTAGDTFSSSDERKTLFSSFGKKIYITEYLDENRVRIHTTETMSVQGFTTDPTYRGYYDTVTDETLRARQDYYSCYSRYRRDMPNCNIGKVIPGFVVCAVRGGKKIYYSNLIDRKDYLIGQYIEVQVSEKILDAIQAMFLFQDVLGIFSSSQTWSAQVGVSDFTTLSKSGEAIALLPEPKQVSKNIGCIDWGSIKEIDGGLVELFTNEQGGEALRQFNGIAYSEENFLVDNSLGGRIEKDLNKTKRKSVATYDGILGYVAWRKNR